MPTLLDSIQQAQRDAEAAAAGRGTQRAFATPAPADEGDAYDRAIAAMMRDRNRGQDELSKREAWTRQQQAALEGQQAGQEAQFAAGRAPLEQASAALGQNVATLQGGPAQMQMQAGLSAGEAGLLQARKTAMGQHVDPTGAILGGHLGQQQAAGFGALSNEAEQGQRAYMQTIQALGQGAAGEAQQRRALEEERMRDLQARFATAQNIAAGQQQQTAAQKQADIATGFKVAGTVAALL